MEYRWNTGANNSSNLGIQELSHSIFLKKLLSEFPGIPNRLIRMECCRAPFWRSISSCQKRGFLRSFPTCDLLILKE